MSAVKDLLGRPWNSAPVHRFSLSTAPPIVKSHSSNDVCGVGPAERTGKPSTRYWPGGRGVDVSGSARLRLKPRETNPLCPAEVRSPDVIHRTALAKGCNREADRESSAPNHGAHE